MSNFFVKFCSVVARDGVASREQKDVRIPQFAIFRLQFHVIDGDRAPFLPTVTSGNVLQISEASTIGSAVGRVSASQWSGRLCCFLLDVMQSHMLMPESLE